MKNKNIPTNSEPYVFCSRLNNTIVSDSLSYLSSNILASFFGLFHKVQCIEMFSKINNVNVVIG